MGNTTYARQRQQVIEQTAIGCLLCWHFGATIAAAEQPAAEARRVADVAACYANICPAQPSPLLGDASTPVIAI